MFGNANKVNKIKEDIISSLKKGKTLSEISRDILGTNSTAKINMIINRYGINPSEYNERYLFMNKKWLAEQLNTLGTPSKVAFTFKIPRTSVTRYAERYGLYQTKFTRKAKNSIDENYFDDINTSEKAYWLGFIMADGSIYHYKNSDRVQFELKLQESDIDVLNKFAEAVGFNKDKIRHSSFKRKDADCKYISLKTYNKTFCRNLSNWGICDHKTGRENFPNKIPIEIRRDFVRGFWDGDGHIDKRRIDVASASFQFISKLSSWLCKSDIHYYIDLVDKIKDKPIYRIKIAKKSWNDFANLVYYPGCTAMNRKEKDIREIQSTIEKW